MMYFENARIARLLLLTFLLPVSCSPPSEESLLERAAALQEEGKSDEAAQILEEARGLYAESSKVHLELAKLCSAREAYGDAVKHYTRALELDPDNLEAHLNFSGYYYKRKNYLSSLKHLEQVVTRGPDSPEAQMARNLYVEVETCLARSVVRGRIQSEMRGRQLSPDSLAFLKSRLADSYAEEGTELLSKNDPAAEAAYREALQLAPGTPSYRVGMASALELQGKMTEAAEQLEKALGVDSSNPRIMLTLAGVYTRLDKDQEAIVLLRRLIEANPLTLEAEIAQRRLEELERAVSSEDSQQQ